MTRIAVCLGDLFWSSIPYCGLDVLRHLTDAFAGMCNVDLIMFTRDIRLNKVFYGDEMYHFDVARFTTVPTLRTVKNWDQFVTISHDYDLVLMPAKIAPKTRYPKNLRQNMGCPIMVWDVGGTDILVDSKHIATYYALKSKRWIDFMTRLNICERTHAWSTGTPHYDMFMDDKLSVAVESFKKKYDLDAVAGSILVTPSNPGSHHDMFDTNIVHLEKLVAEASRRNWRVLLKTYPHDYLFYDDDSQYTGVYHRPYMTSTRRHSAHYEFLTKKIPELTLIESQEHHAALSACTRLFNMTGSHIAWETWFTNIVSLSMNFNCQKYYGGASYIPGVEIPDHVFNVEITDVTKIFDEVFIDKTKCGDFLSREISLPGITRAVADVLDVLI